MADSGTNFYKARGLVMDITPATKPNSPVKIQVLNEQGETIKFTAFDSAKGLSILKVGETYNFSCKTTTKGDATYQNIDAVEGVAEPIADTSKPKNYAGTSPATSPATSALVRPILSPGMDKYSAVANTFHDWNMNRRTALMQESENWRAGKIEESEIFPRATRAFNWLMGESGDDDSEFKEFHEELRKDKESVRLFLNFKFSQLEPQVVNDMLEGMYPETTYDNLSIKESLALLEAVEERVNS